MSTSRFAQSGLLRQEIRLSRYPELAPVLAWAVRTEVLIAWAKVCDDATRQLLAQAYSEREDWWGGCPDNAYIHPRSGTHKFWHDFFQCMNTYWTGRPCTWQDAPLITVPVVRLRQKYPTTFCFGERTANTHTIDIKANTGKRLIVLIEKKLITVTLPKTTHSSIRPIREIRQLILAGTMAAIAGPNRLRVLTTDEDVTFAASVMGYEVANHE